VLFLFAGFLFAESIRIKDQKDTIIFKSEDNNYQSMNALELPVLNDSINPLFNECHYCQKENRKWYSSIINVYNTAHYCGMDFLEIRVDQMFVEKNAAVLTMVYCSARKSSFVIDSVVSVQRNVQASIKNVSSGVSDVVEIDDESIVDSFHSETGLTYIKTLAEKVTDFYGFGEYSENKNLFKYRFGVNGKTYEVDERGILKKIGNYNNSTGKKSSPFRVYYKIGSYSDSIECNEKTENKKSDIVIKLKDRYIFNQCIVDYDITSEIGISSLKFVSGETVDKEISYSGEKSVHGSVSIGFGQKSAALIAIATDVNGNSIQKEIQIFSKIESEKKEREKRNDLQNARKVWSGKSALNSALNNLSKFSGNIITALLDVYCEGKAQEVLLQIPDVFNPQKEHQIVIPVAGRLPYQDTLVKYIYNISIKANSVIHNGTAISEMELPVFVSNQKPLNYSTRFEFPLGSGYYLPAWNIQNLLTDQNESDNFVLICSQVIYKNGMLTLYNFPAILKEPSNHLKYSLLIKCKNDNDRYILTYLGKCIDRSQVILYRAIDEDSVEKSKENLLNDNTYLQCRTEMIAEQEDNKMIVSIENFKCPKKLLALYIFVYSEKLKQTIGIGGTWNHF